MRLIDADKLILHLNDFMLQQSPVDAQDIESINVCAVIQECIKAVEDQPTAYDVDKVIEQLEVGLANECVYERDQKVYTEAIRCTIDIVKDGGINGLD